MYKTSYCIYSISHFFKKPFSSNQDKWLGWKDWLNKKFCDKFMEVNEVSLQETKLTPEQEQKNISALDNFTKAGADPQVIGENSRFNDEVEILPRNKYLMDFLKRSKFDFGLSSYNVHSQLMKAINKTFTAKTIEKMQEGKFAIDYVLNQQVSDDEELEIVDNDELIIEDVTGSVDLHSKAIPNQHISNNKDNISKEALGKAWLAAVKLIAQKEFWELRILNSCQRQLINETASDVIKKLYKQDNSILKYKDNQDNNAIHILASSPVYATRQELLRILEGLDKDCSNELKLKPNKAGHNALQTAVVCKHPDMVYHLLKECTPDQKHTLLTVTDGVGNNPFHLAVIANDNEVVDELLKECTPDQKQNLFAAVNDWGHNILHLAIRELNQPLVTQVLQECTPDQKQKLLTKENEHGNNPIMQAIESRKYDNIESRAQDSCDSIAELQDCFAYLQERINTKSIQQSHNKFQSNLQKIRTTTPELLEIDQQQLTTVRELIQYTSPEGRVKLLKKAILQQKENIIKLVLPTIDSNFLTEDGKSLLELVLGIVEIPERIYMLNLLIDCGVNINIQNRVGETLLHKIVDVEQLTKDAVNCQNKIIEYLVHLGADVNIQNEQGNTPLHIELTRIMRMDDVQPLNFGLLGPRGNVANVDDRLLNIQLLLQNKANPTIQNKQGETPLDIIIKTGDLNQESHIQIFQLLLDKMTHSGDKEADEVAQNRFDLIMERCSKMKYPKFDILYCFAEYIATRVISCQMTKEQCQLLIQSTASKGSIAREKALKQVAYIFKACVIWDESAIPNDIRELMKDVTLPPTLSIKSASNVGNKKQDTKPESKAELEEEEIIEESHGLNDEKSPLPITILLNKTASAGDNTPSDLDNVFVHLVPCSQEGGDGHEIPEIKIVDDISNGDISNALII